MARGVLVFGRPPPLLLHVASTARTVVFGCHSHAGETLTTPQPDTSADALLSRLPAAALALVSAAEAFVPARCDAPRVRLRAATCAALAAADGSN